MDHVRGAPHHPQTQGKIERWHQTTKNRVLLANYYLQGDLEGQIRAFPRPKCRIEAIDDRQGQRRSKLVAVVRQPAVRRRHCPADYLVGSRGAAPGFQKRQFASAGRESVRDSLG